jgi:hypothetical protein
MGMRGNCLSTGNTNTKNLRHRQPRRNTSFGRLLALASRKRADRARAIRKRAGRVLLPLDYRRIGEQRQMAESLQPTMPLAQPAEPRPSRGVLGTLADLGRSACDALCALGNSTRTAAATALIGFVAFSSSASAATINQNAVDNSVDLNYTSMHLKMTNNDSGAIYDSATLDVGLKALSEQIAAQNSSYTAAEALDAISAQIRGPPTGDIETGWSPYLWDQDGKIYLNHTAAGELWTTDQYSDEMALTISVPKYLLDLNGNGWSESDVALGLDSILHLSSTPIVNGFVGHDGGGYVATPFSYESVLTPEPTTFVFLSLGGLSLLRRRKK